MKEEQFCTLNSISFIDICFAYFINYRLNKNYSFFFYVRNKLEKIITEKQNIEL